MPIALKYGISAPIAIAAVIAVIAMVVTMIWHCDSGPNDDYFPEI